MRSQHPDVDLGRDDDAAPPEPGPPRYIAKGILPFTDSSLWAVLFAFVAHIATFLAVVMLKLYRDHSVAGAAVLAVLLVLSTVPIRDELAWRKRLGIVTALVLGTWTLGVTLAWLADTYGVY